MKLTKTFIILLCFSIFIGLNPAYALDDETGFELLDTKDISDLNGKAYYYKHTETGAEVVFLENDSEKLEFSIGFKTPPIDNKGANHVLEHSLLCGSEKYPTKNIMNYLNSNSLAEMINAFTVDDCTYYSIKTANKTEYYNLIDVYMNGIFHPMLLQDENIFKQQGIRLEYIDGKVQYNGVVYNELKIKNLESAENSINFLSDKLYTEIYGNTPPSFNSGGTAEGIKTLSYDDLMRVYHNYYIPSNSMTYISGKQDIKSTLKLLDSFFDGFSNKKPDIAFNDTKQLPENQISEYNITSDTQTVDIGFMSSGAMMSEGNEELYAREIIFNLILQKMNEVNNKTFVTGGNSGGISNSALLVTEIPINEKDNIINTYNAILKQFSEKGFDCSELNSAVGEYISNRKDPYIYAPDLTLFDGIIYKNDPFYYTGISETEKYLKENPEFFRVILDKYFIQNPYSKIVISGNGNKSPEYDDTLSLSSEEIENIKNDTENFNNWVDEPDSPEVIAGIPSLSLDEVKNAPEYYEPKYENVENIPFYYTEKLSTDSSTASLLFPIQDSDLNYIQLLNSLLTRQAQKLNISNVYFDILSMESYNDENKFDPQLIISMSSPDNEITELLEKVIEFLDNDSIWNQNDFEEYLKTAPNEILKNGYRDPFYLSYELMHSSQSAEKRLYSSTRGSIGQGSVTYYHFLKGTDLHNAPQILTRLKDMVQNIILNTAPTVEYVGGNGYDDFKTAVCEYFKNSKQAENSHINLPVGCYSAAAITNIEDSNHFMQAGYFSKNLYTGKMNVLAKVLTTKYILPTMRGKYGAYGAGVSFDDSGMVCSVAGLTDIDLAIKIWDGMDDYLKSLDMTQKELDAIIVPIVKEYDEYYNNSEYGATMALTGKTNGDIKKVRDEMISTTVEDLKQFAGLIDELTAQKRIFAVLSKKAADNAEFKFAYYANANTLEITPRLKENPGKYIKGDTDNTLPQDRYLTRAETAEIISRLLVDECKPVNQNEFKDIKTDDWFYDSVISVYEKQIMKGYDDKTFLPDNNITRAEFAAVFSKFIYEVTDKSEVNYNDLDFNDWFYTPVSKMTNCGYMNGYEDGTFRPNDYITRDEALTVIDRMINSK